MKRIISGVLCLIMALAALVSCADTKDSLDRAITLASSDAAQYAEWLDGRLEVIPDDVVIGLGSNSAYGVDMTDFENDGYIVRNFGGEVLLFGKSSEGLDLAVRKYAKAAEAGQTANLDEVYHEGYRIESLSIAGNDISGYEVVYGEGVESVSYSELPRLIEKACGVGIPAVPADAANASAKHIYLSTTDDSTLKDTGCRYKVENGEVYIEGNSYIGIAYGIYLFLQNECGWEDLVYGDSDLKEAEHVDIPDGTAEEYIMLADYFMPYNQFYSRYENDRSSYWQGFYGKIPNCCHGIMNWSGSVNPWTQMCYTNDDEYDEVYLRIYDYLEKKTAAGFVIGKDLNFIDIAQVDWFGYCLCAECSKVYKEEGNVHSGAVVRFANKLSEELSLDFPGVKYGIFAYHGTNIPCKTAPNDDVYVTFCTDGHCSTHTINGGECYGESFDFMGYYEKDSYNNFDYAEWIKEWCRMSDNIYIWFYALDNNVHQYTTIDQLYDDFRFFYECGVKGVFWQHPYHGLGITRVELQLGMAINYDPEMTEDEYYALVDRLLEKEYGDGWVYVKEYLNILEEAEYKAGCNNCWAYATTSFDGQVDRDYYAANFDRMTELLEAALLEANSEKQEKHCELLTVSMYYMGCGIQYFEAYDKEDYDRLDILNERYDLLISRLRNNGIDPAGIVGVDGVKVTIAETLEGEAWSSWVGYREWLSPAGTVQRPAPEAPASVE